MARETRKYLGRKFAGEILNTNGEFKFSERVIETIRRVGRVVGSIVENNDKIQLPETKEERLSLARVLTDSLVHFDGRLEVICPACPDYGKGKMFYRMMGDSLSPEAMTGIRSSRTISDILLELGFSPSIKIVIADTEDDLPEIIQNCAAGDINFYRNSVQGSVDRVASELREYECIEVMTFTGLYGDRFREKQYLFEELIRGLIANGDPLKDVIEKIGEERKVKHTQILGRDEADYQLTIRYMAQYAALGHIARERYPQILMNYPTPNRRFYNAAVNVNGKLVLDEGDFRVVPVIGTKVKRKNI